MAKGFKNEKNEFIPTEKSFKINSKQVSASTENIKPTSVKSGKKLTVVKDIQKPSKPEFIVTERKDEMRNNLLTREQAKKEIGCVESSSLNNVNKCPNVKTNLQELEISPKTFLMATDNDANWIPDHGIDSVKNLKFRMENGLPIDRPILVFDPSNKHHNLELDRRMREGKILLHEGRHRSFVAKKLGISKELIDVYIIKNGLSKPKKITEKDIIKAEPQFESDSAIDKKASRVREDLKNYDSGKKQSEVNHEKIEKIFQ